MPIFEGRLERLARLDSHAELFAMDTTQDKAKLMVLDERRSGNERRRRDGVPPNNWERRRAIEPRKPEVLDMEITPSQWDALHGAAFPEAGGKTSNRS